MAAYVPKQGDIIAITFDPQSGHEQKGRRPALVVSKDLYWVGYCMPDYKHRAWLPISRPYP